MKKFLLASTALVSAFGLVHQADAQQLTTDSPFTVRIDGFANFRFGFVSESNRTPVAAPFGNAVRNAAVQTAGRTDLARPDTEVHITATGKADNGLVYGMYVEIEGDPVGNLVTTATFNSAGGSGVATAAGATSHSSTSIDEAHIFLQGGWGRVEFGDQDGAGDQLWFAQPYDFGPAYGDGSGVDGDIMFRWANSVGYRNISGGVQGSPLYTYNVKAFDSSDATKMTYLTPVISGFRAGISFVPDGANNGFLPGTGGSGGRSGITASSLTAAQIGAGANPLTGVANAAPAVVGTQGVAGVSNPVGTYGDYQHWIELGAQWRGTIGDVGLGASFAYTHAEHKRSVFQPAGAAGGTTAAGTFAPAGTVAGPYNFNDINSWALGGQVSWMGITVGGSYANHGRSVYLSGPFLQRGSDAWATTAGIQYAIGPWVVGYNYSYSADSSNTSPFAGVRANSVDYHGAGAKYILAPGLFVFGEYAHYTVNANGVTVNVGDVGLLGTGVRF